MQPFPSLARVDLEPLVFRRLTFFTISLLSLFPAIRAQHIRFNSFPIHHVYQKVVTYFAVPWLLPWLLRRILAYELLYYPDGPS